MISLAEAPLEPTREEARRWAVEELSKQPYQADRPGLVERALQWVTDHLFNVTVPTGTGSAVVLTVVVCLVIALVAFAVSRVGLGGRRAKASQTPVLSGVVETAAQLRLLAARHAADGAWAEAVIATFRVVARELESSADLRALPGRTAAELADAGAAQWPALEEQLRVAANTFDAVAYGHRAATESDYRRLAAVEESVRRATNGRWAPLPSGPPVPIGGPEASG